MCTRAACKIANINNIDTLRTINYTIYPHDVYIYNIYKVRTARRRFTITFTSK